MSSLPMCPECQVDDPYQRSWMHLVPSKQHPFPREESLLGSFRRAITAQYEKTTFVKSKDQNGASDRTC